MSPGKEAQEGKKRKSSAELDPSAKRNKVSEDTQEGSSDSSTFSPHNDISTHESDGTGLMDTTWKKSTLSQCLKNKWASPVFIQQQAPSYFQHGDPVIQDKPMDSCGHSPEPVEVQQQVETKRENKRKADEELDIPAKKVYQQIGLGSFIRNAPPKEFVCPQKKCQQKFLNKDELIIHFRTKHRQCRDRNFCKYSMEGNYCELCEKKICHDDQADSNTKLLHLICAHPLIKQHYCAGCCDFKMFSRMHASRCHKDPELVKEFEQRCNQAVKHLYADKIPGYEGFRTHKNTIMEARKGLGRCPNCQYCSPEDSDALAEHLRDCVYKSDAQQSQKGGAVSTSDAGEPSTSEQVQEFEQQLFKGKGRVAMYKNKKIEPDVESAFSNVREAMKKQIEAQLEKSPVVKLHTEANLLLQQQKPAYEDADDPSQSVYVDKMRSINSGNYMVSKASDIDEVLDEITADTAERAASMQDGPSNFMIQDVVNLRLSVYNANRLETASYLPLPPKLKKKVLKRGKPPALINPRNSDAFCFLRNIAMFLDEKEAAAQTGESLKKRLYDMSKEMDYANETFFQEKYGKTFQKLKEKVEHTISFPFEINKRNLAKLTEALALEDFVINVFQATICGFVF